MAAIDTVFTFVANPGATYTATAASPGDSLVVRSFNTPGSPAQLENIFRRGATAGAARVRSPVFHDNVTGINLDTSETANALGMPFAAYQVLKSADTLIVEVTGGSSETDGAALSIYYPQGSGFDARLASWGDVSGIIKSYKSFQVAVTNSATIGTWTDTVITTTENQFHADSDYVVLGYQSSVALGMVGVKGPETANFRNCGPGNVGSIDTSDWYLRQSNESGYAAMPVFNANNRANTYVSTVDVAASTAAVITLNCMELSQPAPV